MRNDPGDLGSGVGCSSSERFEVDVRGQVLLAGIDEGRNVAVPADRLQSVAGCGSLMPIVDDQGGTAVIGNEPGESGSRFIARGRLLDDLTIPVERQTRLQRS